MQNHIFKVSGMSCEHCKKSVESALQTLSGMQYCAVDFKKGEVVVTFDSSALTTNMIQDAIQDAGYEVE